mmetsp:Transcript_16284/g.48590  ORF Transcript_16284/g.48590 Transcript_16284/m.48590 type:complete len:282 (-) Transcript_16284:318-1163(-)
MVPSFSFWRRVWAFIARASRPSASSRSSTSSRPEFTASSFAAMRFRASASSGVRPSRPAAMFRRDGRRDAGRSEREGASSENSRAGPRRSSSRLSSCFLRAFAFEPAFFEPPPKMRQDSRRFMFLLATLSSWFMRSRSRETSPICSSCWRRVSFVARATSDVPWSWRRMRSTAARVWSCTRSTSSAVTFSSRRASGQGRASGRAPPFQWSRRPTFLAVARSAMTQLSASAAEAAESVRAGPPPPAAASMRKQWGRPERDPGSARAAAPRRSTSPLSLSPAP